MTRAAIEKMGMRVDKARAHQGAAGVDYLACAIAPFDLRRRCDRNNPSIVHGQPAMLEHCDAFERIDRNALLRAGASQQFACIPDDQVDFLGRSLAITHRTHLDLACPSSHSVE